MPDLPEEAVEAAREAIRTREKAYRDTGSGRMTPNAIIGNALEAAAPAIEEKARKQERERLKLDPRKLRALALELPAPIFNDAVKPTLDALEDSDG
jgi:hypothetical protein